MSRHTAAVANRLSLRPPQRRSLEILDPLIELAPPSKTADRTAALSAIQAEFPTENMSFDFLVRSALAV